MCAYLMKCSLNFFAGVVGYWEWERSCHDLVWSSFFRLFWNSGPEFRRCEYSWTTSLARSVDQLDSSASCRRGRSVVVRASRAGCRHRTSARRLGVFPCVQFFILERVMWKKKEIESGGEGRVSSLVQHSTALEVVRQKEARACQLRPRLRGSPRGNP